MLTIDEMSSTFWKYCETFSCPWIPTFYCLEGTKKPMLAKSGDSKFILKWKILWHRKIFCWVFPTHVLMQKFVENPLVNMYEIPKMIIWHLALLKILYWKNFSLNSRAWENNLRDSSQENVRTPVSKKVVPLMGC